MIHQKKLVAHDPTRVPIKVDDFFKQNVQFFRAELPNMDDPEASLGEYNIKPAVNTANRMAALRFQWIPSKEKPTKMPQFNKRTN